MANKKEKFKLVKPKEEIIRIFTPTMNFDDGELRSSYVKGELYFIRKGNNKLANKVRLWLRDGRVKIVDMDKVSISKNDEEK